MIENDVSREAGAEGGEDDVSIDLTSILPKFAALLLSYFSCVSGVLGEMSTAFMSVLTCDDYVGILVLHVQTRSGPVSSFGCSVCLQRFHKHT